MYWSSILVTLCSKNSLYISCFKGCHPVVVRMRSHMVVPNIYILCYRVIQCFRIHKMIPIYQFILKCFIKPLHGCIIIRTPLSVSTASSVFRWSEFNDATTEQSYRSIIVQLYRIFPLYNQIYVKSVHHILFFASAVKFCFKRFGNILFFSPCT